MGSEDVGKILEDKEKLMKRVCDAAMNVHNKSSNDLFKEKITESEIIFSFRGTWELKDWYTQEPFGATKINENYFPSLRTIGNNEAAIVNEAFQAKFISILEQTQLQKKIKNALKDKKQIVFTGHSSGGAVAALVTIWFLEKKANWNDNTGSEPLCVTFGSPLIGNHIFSHALRREKWSRHFIHFVTRLDIVPRLFLSPLNAVNKPHFERLLQSITPRKFKGGSSHNNGPALDEHFMAVISGALTLTSHVASKLMESTNQLSEIVTSFIHLSPYRPFGNYVFVDQREELVSQVSLNNSEAVLQYLFFSCQPSNEDEVRDFAGKIVGEHSAYGDRLAKIKRWKIYGGIGSDDDKMSEVIKNSDQFGLSQRGILHLLAARESEKQKLKNLQKIESKIQMINDEMNEIDKYKRMCGYRKIGYFDSFKQQKSDDDFKANISRLKQAGIWDEILELLKSNKLPDDFEGNKTWIDLGNRYRILVEPIDIANYYRHLKNEDTGAYMGVPGRDRMPRPKRYRFPQKWFEHYEKLGKDSCGESNFWAELEELSHGRADNFDCRAKELQEKLVRWNSANPKMIPDDVFLSESTFVKWWTSLEDRNKVKGIERLLNKEG